MSLRAVIATGDIQGFHKILREAINNEVYDDLSIESKKFIIKNVISNTIYLDDNIDNDETTLFICKIIELKEFYDLISVRILYFNEMSNMK